MNTSFGELDLNDILEYVNSDGKLTYSFLINKDLDIENPYAFENLHMVKLQEGYLGYILRWEPDHDWFENNSFEFSLQHFTGKQLHFDLDYNLLQETNFTNGQPIINSSSNKSSFSSKQNKSMEMEIVCIEIVSDLCEYTGADYCGGSICGFGVKTSCYLAIVSGGGSTDDGSGDTNTNESGGGTKIPRTGDTSEVVDDGDATVVVDEPEWTSSAFLIDLFHITDPEVKAIFYDTAFSDSFYRYMKWEYYSEESYIFAAEVIAAKLNGGEVDFENLLIYNPIVAQDYKANMSEAEIAIFDTLNSVTQGLYLKAATQAYIYAETHFPKPVRNRKGDAFKHTFWNALSTVYIGETLTEQLTTAHEDITYDPNYPNHYKETQMDLHNNAQGRQIAYGAGKLYQLVQTALDNGNLRYLNNLEFNGVFWKATDSSQLIPTNQ